MEDRKVSTKKIHGELKKVKGIVTTTDEFYDRFYLIHGIYGHALKTITGRRVLFL
jgi:cyanate lyase